MGRRMCVEQPLVIAGLEAAVVCEAPPGGAVSASPECLENDVLRVASRPTGRSRACGTARGREVLAGRGNQLWAYVDSRASGTPGTWTRRTPRRGPSCARARRPRWSRRPAPRRRTRRACVRDSRIVQKVRLWAGSARIDFATRLDWHDRRWLVKVRFPLAERFDRATFETAFGVVDRPRTATRHGTSPLRGRGAPLRRPVGAGLRRRPVNDRRYGHHALGPSGAEPAAVADVARSAVDEGVQEITYALYPHAGDGWRAVCSRGRGPQPPVLVRRVTATADGGSCLRP